VLVVEPARAGRVDRRGVPGEIVVERASLIPNDRPPDWVIVMFSGPSRNDLRRGDAQ
jgi:hypothetical protein